MKIKMNKINVLLLLFTILCLSFNVFGYCEKDCNGHGTCEARDKCSCYKGRDGYPLYTGNDCSKRTCPRGLAWIGEVQKSNDLHPFVECSNMGDCNRNSGLCNCFNGRDGVACERTTCPLGCSGNGICYTQKQLAAEVGRVYETPWDANKMVACMCDIGYRGLDCSLIECPSGADVMRGPGNEQGRDCSGRGICNYEKGVCECFMGFFGRRCEHQTSVIV